MIWVGGKVGPDSDLKVSVLDRTFEHGLGLFETLRTWNGRPRLLDRHLARLIRSAGALGLPLEPADLPNSGAVEELARSSGIAGDALIRITLTGGPNASSGSLVWMRAGPLPPSTSGTSARLWLSDRQINPTDPLARHKTLNYWQRRIVSEEARGLGCDEALLMTPDTTYWEGARTNVFAWTRGRLVTPALSGPILPGVMRALVIELAREAGCAVSEEAGFSKGSICSSDEVFLTNSVRGVVPVGEAVGNGWPGVGPWKWQAPGPFTAKLAGLLAGRLEVGGL